MHVFVQLSVTVKKACTRAKIDGPIDIGGIQRYVTDMERKMNMKILKAGASEWDEYCHHW